MSVFLNNLSGIFETFRPIIDIIDILAVAFILYYAIRLVRETRAMQLVKSIGVVFGIFFIASYLNMITLKAILGAILNIGLIVLVVLFQPELRRALERIGRSRIADLGRLGGIPFEDGRIMHTINSICEACEGIISRKEGALIALEQDTRLGDYANSGTIVDANISAELIGNLFFHNSPLHDGAVILRGYRIYAAGCFLPLSGNMEIGREMGTRHRAALGLSEVSDAIILVVSEERGTISIAQESSIRTDLTPAQLKEILLEKLVKPQEEKKGFWKFGEKKNEK